MGIIIKTPAEIETMRRAGKIQADILNAVGKAIRIGISTKELDELADKLCEKYNAKPAFKGYNGFPAALCTSVNNQVVHGIPSLKQILKNGDIITLDFGIILDGLYADSCQTFLVGEVSEKTKLLVERTKKALYLGIGQAQAGNHVGDIGQTIQSYVEQFGYSPVRETVGHGIGCKLHEDPEIPNHGKAKTGPKLVADMTICIEPIINAGKPEIVTESDNWTTHTADGSLCAHFEHQILITENAPEILTPWDE